MRAIERSITTLEQMHEKRARFLCTLLQPPRRVPITALTAFLAPLPEGPQKFVLILSQETNYKRLRAIDRYERRALFRRRIAIQVLMKLSRRLQISYVAIISCMARKTKPNS
jgi:hypothetical protein